jgi:hypothetical protein
MQNKCHYCFGLIKEDTIPLEEGDSTSLIEKDSTPLVKKDFTPLLEEDSIKGSTSSQDVFTNVIASIGGKMHITFTSCNIHGILLDFGLLFDLIFFIQSYHIHFKTIIIVKLDVIYNCLSAYYI